MSRTLVTYTQKGFYGEGLTAGTKFVTEVFQMAFPIGAKEISPSSFCCLLSTNGNRRKGGVSYHPYRACDEQALTQIRSCTNTTFPFLQARCRAVRPSPSPQVSFTSSRVPWARSRMTVRRSSSAVALRRCWPRESSRHCSGARKSFCSYFARIQRSFSSLEKPKRIRHSGLALLPTSMLANSHQQKESKKINQADGVHVGVKVCSRTQYRKCTKCPCLKPEVTSTALTTPSHPSCTWACISHSRTTPARHSLACRGAPSIKNCVMFPMQKTYGGSFCLFFQNANYQNSTLKPPFPPETSNNYQKLSGCYYVTG